MKTRKETTTGKFNPISYFETRVEPSTLSESARTVEVVFSTGQRGERNSYWEGKYFEELSMNAGHIRLDYLNSGNAPVLRMHGRYSLDDVVGVVVRAWIENGEGRAILRYSEDEEADKIFRKIKEGVLNNVSVGYRVYKYEETFEGEGERRDRILRAVDWEPKEISPVPIGFDSTAQVRSGENNSDEKNFNICEITREVEMKTDKVKTPEQENQARVEAPVVAAPVVEAPKVDTDKIREEGIVAERARVSEITEACRLGGVDSADFIAKGVTVDECRKQVLSMVAKNQEETSQVASGIEVTRDETDTLRDGMSNALTFRIGNSQGQKVDLDDNCKRFANMNMLQMARHAVGDKDFKLTKSQVVTRAFHSTSDFPLILEDTTRKTLRRAFDELPVTFSPFVRRTTTPDFKTISRNRLSDVDQLLPKAEGAEYKQGSLGEEGEKYNVSTYGRVFAFTREMLINDDMDAFSRLPVKYGRAARRLESDKVWAIITGNPLMADGNALFSGAHSNLGTGAALGETPLSEARKLMRLHADLKGEPLNISPMYLAVPAELETAAQKLLTTIDPDSTTNVNPFSFMRLIVEPRLDAASATAYYVMSEMSQLDMIELATLEGEGSPDIVREDDFKTDSVCWRVRHEIGTAPIDYRGFVKNAGV